MAQSYLVSDMGFQWFCHRIAVSLWPGMGTKKKKKPQLPFHNKIITFTLGNYSTSPSESIDCFLVFLFFFSLFFSFFLSASEMVQRDSPSSNAYWLDDWKIV